MKAKTAFILALAMIILVTVQTWIMLKRRT